MTREAAAAYAGELEDQVAKLTEQLEHVQFQLESSHASLAQVASASSEHVANLEKQVEDLTSEIEAAKDKLEEKEFDQRKVSEASLAHVTELEAEITTLRAQVEQGDNDTAKASVLEKLVPDLQSAAEEALQAKDAELKAKQEELTAISAGIDALVKDAPPGEGEAAKLAAALKRMTELEVAHDELEAAPAMNKVYMHELFHLFGAQYHMTSYVCNEPERDLQDILRRCEIVNYGDQYDNLGGGAYAHNTAAHLRYAFGWLGGDDVEVVDHSAEYAIHPINAAYDPTNPKKRAAFFADNPGHRVGGMWVEWRTGHDDAATSDEVLERNRASSSTCGTASSTRTSSTATPRLRAAAARPTTRAAAPSRTSPRTRWSR